MGKIKYSFLTLTVALAVGCSQGTSVSLPTQPQVDASLKVTVLNQQTAYADGFSDLTVTVLVEDRVGNKLQNFTPSVEVKNSAQGVNFATCTATNAQGESTCVFRATLDGTKQVSIGGRVVDIVFTENASPGGNMFSIVSSAQTNVGAGTDFVTSTVGSTFDTPRQEMGSWFLRTDISIQY